jgi:hypothetical protein
MGFDMNVTFKRWLLSVRRLELVGGGLLESPNSLLKKTSRGEKSEVKVRWAACGVPVLSNHFPANGEMLAAEWGQKNFVV